ncbi:MAG TPA: hypothetical protein VGW80_06430 [Solirubrobacterales bacterium]|nr:hypothetical protein [Solirubrobacterales bacterium]
MPAAVRFQLAGCALLAALLLGGCGSGGSDQAETTAATVTSNPPTTVAKEPGSTQKKRKKHLKTSAAGPCQSQLGSFVASMDSLRRRLAVGVTFDQYLAEVRGIRSTYRKIPIGEVEIDCLDAVGTQAEKAFNRYIEAANDWGECVSEAGCSSETVEPVLQRRWRIASHFLGEADEGLNASAP